MCERGMSGPLLTFAESPASGQLPPWPSPSLRRRGIAHTSATPSLEEGVKLALVILEPLPVLGMACHRGSVPHVRRAMHGALLFLQRLSLLLQLLQLIGLSTQRRGSRGTCALATHEAVEYFQMSRLVFGTPAGGLLGPMPRLKGA